MDKTINFNELPDLTNILGLCIPDGTVETFESEDLKCHLEKDNGHLKIEIEANIPEQDGEFDDSSTKEIVKEYKEGIKALDDDLFVEIVDELIKSVEALQKKYETTYFDIEKEIKETEASLCSMIDDLVGDEYDMKGLSELKSLLSGEQYGKEQKT